MRITPGVSYYMSMTGGDLNRAVIRHQIALAADREHDYLYHQTHAPKHVTPPATRAVGQELDIYM